MKAMLRALIIMFCAIMPFTLLAQSFKNPDLTITKLEGNMWVIETTDNTTMYLVEGTEKALLIDTGTKCQQLDSVVRLITKKPLSVVLTHAHPDHAGNIHYFDEIYLHPADTVLMDKSYHGKLHFIDEGYLFDLGGTVLEVVHMPAHTPGSIVLMDKGNGNCYSGDAFGSGQVWLQLRPVAPMKTYVGCCERMEKWMEQGIDSVYCGHYVYAQHAFSKKYITTMRLLAESLDKENNPKSEPYPIIVSFGTNNPRIVTMDSVGIVYDPEHLK